MAEKAEKEEEEVLRIVNPGPGKRGTGCTGYKNTPFTGSSFVLTAIQSRFDKVLFL
jgi:hypothetical protein